MRPVRIALILGSLLVNSTVALSQPAHDNPEKQMQELLKTVQLTPEQKDKVRQIRESGRIKMQALRDDLEKRREDLNQVLDTNGDDSAVRFAFQNLQNVKRALETARFERMLAIRAVLSNEQRAAFQQMRQTRERIPSGSLRTRGASKLHDGIC